MIHQGDECWRLEIPPGPKGQYRLAQLDDYSELPRTDFPWQPPLRLSLTARVSSPSVPGTWGFGLWNDPFSLSLGFGGGSRRFPALPSAAWFFYASAQNYLSFQDDKPARGFLVQTFHSPEYPVILLGSASIGLPLMVFPSTAKIIRRLMGKVILEDSYLLTHDPTMWHDFILDWELGKITFRVNGATEAVTNIIPGGKLGLVIWIDNQYLSFPPEGKLTYGALGNQEPAWLEIKGLGIFQ